MQNYLQEQLGTKLLNSATLMGPDLPFNVHTTRSTGGSLSAPSCSSDEHAAPSINGRLLTGLAQQDVSPDAHRTKKPKIRDLRRQICDKRFLRLRSWPQEVETLRHHVSGNWPERLVLFLSTQIRKSGRNLSISWQTCGVSSCNARDHLLGFKCEC